MKAPLQLAPSFAVTALILAEERVLWSRGHLGVGLKLRVSDLRARVYCDRSRAAGFKYKVVIAARRA